MASWMMAALVAVSIGVSPDVQVVEFSAAWCRPCQQMQPALERLAQEGWAIRRIDVDSQRDLAERYRVQALPTLLIMIRGQEVDRIVGAASFEQLAQRFEAASRAAQAASGAAPAQLSEDRAQPQSPAQSNQAAHQPTVRGQSPSSLGAFPLLAAASGATKLASAAARELTSAATAASSQLADQAHASQPRTISPSEALARAEAATVRIRVDDARSQAFGTGTIVDTHGDEALVLTCGHILRDVEPDSRLMVELFTGSHPVALPAQIVDFDATEADIGLISFRTTLKLTPAAIMPVNHKPQLGQSAFSFGCDRGANPSRRDTKIKRIDRYVGASNLEIEGAPVVGRSGGGLFDLQGRLLGVCNAADAEDDEGIYAGPPVIHGQLRKLGLERLIDSPHPAQPLAPQASQLVSTFPPVAHPVTPNPAVAPQAQPQQWPDQNAQFNEQLRTLQLSSPANDSTRNSNAASAPPAGAARQLICIVRDASGQDRVVTVNAPTPELLNSIQSQSVSK